MVVGCCLSVCLDLALFFFFNDTAPSEIYTLSLHDALPIWLRPSQSVMMMTWTSDRSGIASIGVLRSAQYPEPTIARMKRTTRNAFRAENWMMRSITASSHSRRAGRRRAAAFGRTRVLVLRMVHATHVHGSHVHPRHRHRHRLHRGHQVGLGVDQELRRGHDALAFGDADRKSTRLNSSHG